MKRYAVFAHYDSKGIVHEYVFFYLKELRKVSDTIIFVSDGTIRFQDKKRLTQYADVVLDEKHGEYDWGSYKRGYFFLKDRLTQKDEIVFCNDSVFGPLVPFKPIFKKMEKQETDVWGMNTASEAFLMSFFLVIRSSVFQKDYLHRFMKNIVREKTKECVVEKYEKGFSKLLEQNNHRMSAYFTPSEIVNRKFQDIPFFSFFKYFVKNNDFEVYDDSVIYLIKNGFPFIKKLSFKNKKNYLNVWYPYLTNKYNIGYIEDYFSFKRLNSNLKLLFKLITITILKISPTKYFFFSKKTAKSGKTIVKVCKIPIFIRKEK